MTDIGQLRFLVVEDQGFQRWLIANVLKDFGARSVVAAGHGSEALQLLSGEPVDVVITDLDMPEMDGMELIRRLAELHRSVGVILVSSYDRSLIATVESMAKAYSVAVLGAVQKPLTAKKLQAVLSSLHPKKETVSPNPSPPLIAASEVERAVRTGEFETHFQPKVDLKTGQVRGAEALVRWKHPTQGLLRPAVFMRAIEDGGWIERLTQHVVSDALRNCVEWRKAGIAASVSVNLNAAMLSNVSLADRMAALVAESALEPAHVTFEVTESTAVRDEGPTLENLSRLRMKGFGLSIDDYGTGYSSMERLARIPFTELKIDQGFVKNAATEASSRAMVESSLELAKKLAIVAVAEGVESQPQWSLLLALGCDQAQGHYICAPVDGADFRRWVANRTKLAMK